MNFAVLAYQCLELHGAVDVAIMRLRRKYREGSFDQVRRNYGASCANGPIRRLPHHRVAARRRLRIELFGVFEQRRPESGVTRTIRGSEGERRRGACALQELEENKPQMETDKHRLFRVNGTVTRDPAVDSWLKSRDGELGAIARQWFAVMRKCGDEVREVLHDGCPTACLGDAAFAYVGVFTAHVNVGFFRGALLPDPAGLLQGNGKLMRHVKVRPGIAVDTQALNKLVELAYSDIKACVENG